ncbi:hypothetical protein C5167_027919 [Papaver somniferum]|nr:hypothetical protein C5167_027919 [Papaver somniferum]
MVMFSVDEEDEEVYMNVGTWVNGFSNSSNKGDEFGKNYDIMKSFVQMGVSKSIDALEKICAVRFAGTQPLNVVAFVLDGLYYGVSDFAYATYSMVTILYRLLIGLASSLFILVSVPVYGLAEVWMGLFLFMILRVFAGIWRLGSKSGPWITVWSQIEQKSN